MAGIPVPAPDADGDADERPVTIDAVVQLLRDDRLRSYRIDVETDQMVEADEDAEKQRRIELMSAMGGFINQAAPLIMSPVGAAIAPMVGETLMFTLRGFKAGRQVEEAFEKGVDALLRQLGRPQAPQEAPQQAPQDPATMLKAQTDFLRAQIEERRQAKEAEELDRRFRLDVAATAISERKQDADIAATAASGIRMDQELALKQRQQEHAEHTRAETLADTRDAGAQTMNARRAEPQARSEEG